MEYTAEQWKEIEIDKVVDGYYDVKEEDKLKVGVICDNT